MRLLVNPMIVKWFVPLMRYKSTFRTINELPVKSEFSLVSSNTHSKEVCEGFRVDEFGVSQLAEGEGSNLILTWKEPPKNVLLVKKSDNAKATSSLIDIARWLQQKYDANIVVEPNSLVGVKDQLSNIYTFQTDTTQDLSKKIDFAVTLGGDGTILHSSALFEQHVPPIISFSMGNLGFLMPFEVQHYRQTIDKFYSNHSSLLLRMRLSCSVYRKSFNVKTMSTQVMNDVILHRGREPHLIHIECYVNEQLLTSTLGDGLIVASPTGSTAYSLSAGGSVVHPSLSHILLTPICPRSLSFRPAILPANAVIKLKVSQSSRALPEVSLDGRNPFFLDRSEYLEVRMSPYPLLTVDRVQGTSDWVRNLNDLLKWNQNFADRAQFSTDQGEYFEDPNK